MAEVSHHITEDVEQGSDDTGQYAITVTPTQGLLALNGSRVCESTGFFPPRFSLLFKFKLEGHRSSVTLFNVAGQLSVTLDACNSQLIINYGRGTNCPFRNMTLSLKEDLAPSQWHKIGLAFTDDHLSLYVNCRLAEWRDLPGCLLQCNGNTPISLLDPNQYTQCSSSSRVRNLLV